MSAAWLDDANAAMVEWGLEAADVFGGVTLVDLAANEARLAVTGDFVEFEPARGLESLDEALGQLEYGSAVSQ
jgi:hypothetical protein